MADRFIIIRLMLILLWIGISQKWNRYHTASGVVLLIVVLLCGGWINGLLTGWMAVGPSVGEMKGVGWREERPNKCMEGSTMD